MITKTTKYLSLLAVLLVSIGAAYFAIATNDISSKVILDVDKTIIGQNIQYPPDSAQITSKIVTIPVGAQTGPHIHEYPVFGYVMEGEITVDYGERGTKTFVKGDALMEAMNYTHNGRNSGDESAKILIVIMGK